jgi:hypothetical protein
MTGLFSHRTLCPQGVVFRQRAIAERRQLIDRFAECLANGGEVQACAARLGKSPSWGRNALAEIRRGLGWQAQ